MTISGIVAAKKLLRKRLVRSAARKYTHVWNNTIKELQGTRSKTNKLPPGFIGNQNQKYKRAQLYKNRIINYAIRNPKKYKGYLFRGISGVEKYMFGTKPNVNKNTLSSFSKNIKVAKKFGSTILRLKPGRKPLASINFTNGNFQSEWNKGGNKWEPGTNEREVLLPPGKFIRRHTNRRPGLLIYNVSFVPTAKKNQFAYLHTSSYSRN